MQIKITRTLKYDFGDYEIILDKNKIGIWRNSVKFRYQRLGETIFKIVWLKNN